MNTLASRVQFKPRIKGEWMPIYLEPIIMSGERLTIAIAAICETGQTQVFRTLDNQLIKLMYKERASEIMGIINFSLTSLEHFVSKNKNLSYWKSPLSGVIAGKTVPAEGVEFKYIINQGIQRSSSLSKLYTGVEIEAEEDQVQERISTMVSNSLISINPVYKRYTNKTVDLGDEIERRYNFVNPDYVSNITVVDRSSSYNAAVVKIVHLHDLKHDRLSSHNDFEMILTQNATKKIDVSVANKIKAESGRYNINCIILNESPEKIADYIHEKAKKVA